MSQDDLLRRIVIRLDEASVAYMVAGSVASGYWGEPRSTNDVDIVIDAPTDRIERFVASIEDQGYVSRVAMHEAIRERSLFGLVDYATGWKADFILRKARPFSIMEFRRRRDGHPIGVEAKVASPEDVLLSKLEWSKLGESQRQFRDAANVYAIMRGKLDEAYLDRWADELGVADLLTKVRSSDEDA